MTVERITSLKNPRILAWRSLKEPKGRKAHEAFLVEGLRMTEEALFSPFPLLALLLREGDADLEEQVLSLLDRMPAERRNALSVFRLPPHVFAAVTDTKTPQGVAAVLRLMQPLLPAGRRFVALDGLQDPGNVGTVLRTADAAGFDGVILGPDCADVFSPKVLRASMGSIFRVGLAFPGDLSLALEEMRTQGFSVLASVLDGSPFYGRGNVGEKLVLVIGNEGNGISGAVRAVSTHLLRLPMRGGAESLNAAVAAGIMMYDLTREDPDSPRRT